MKVWIGKWSWGTYYLLHHPSIHTKETEIPYKLWERYSNIMDEFETLQLELEHYHETT